MTLKYRVVERFRGKYAVEDMCAVFEVSRSGYYAWRKRKQQTPKDKWLVELIIECQQKCKYFTNLDTEDWNAPEGRMALYNLVASSFTHGALTNEIFVKSWWTVDEIYDGLYKAIQARVERTNSLSYKIGKSFESILGDEDIVKKIAENRKITEKPIDMMKVLEDKEKESKEKTPLNMFAKK